MPFQARPALLAAVLLPAIVAVGIMYRQSLPVPYQDDYNTVLAFAVDYASLPSVKTKIVDVVTAQSNEYKLGFEHGVVAAELELTHHLNFAFLTALGNFFVLPLGYLLWRTYREIESDVGESLLAFLPISLLFFSLTYWESLNWTTTGLVNTPVIFFSLLAVYLLLPAPPLVLTRGRLLLACLSAVLAAFTSAGGFLLAPVGLAILLPRRAWGRSLLWCAAFVLPLWAYLYHYSRPVHALSGAPFFTRPLFFLAFLGCGALPSRWPAAGLGVVILGVLGLAARSRFDRVRPVGAYFTLWILGTAALAAWVRGGSLFQIGSRYSIYSLLVLIFCYSFLRQFLSVRWRRCFLIASLVFAFCICLFADLHAYKKLGARRRMVLAGMELYRADPRDNSPMIDQNLLRGFPGERGYEQDILTKAIHAGVYALPPARDLE